MYGVIFDMDGVLVDSNPAHFKAFQKLGERLRVPFTRELLLKTFGMHNNQIFRIWLGELPQERVSALADEKESFYRELASKGEVAAIPGAVELMGALYEAGIAVTIGTSGPPANVELIVKRLGLARFVRPEAIATGADVSRGKPDPEIFLKAAAKLGLEPRRCLVIEDAPPGVAAARAAGMRVIALTSTSPADALRAADQIVDSLEKITIENVRSLIDAR